MSTQIGTVCLNRESSDSCTAARADNTLDLAREVCEYFRLKLQDADEIIDDFRGVVSQWRTLATRLALPAREQERMAGAFHLAND
ncbi:hypothetical protein ACPUER_01760 [Burkholderia sp. DN3021]|uniref:hypothetical protein n=1 Tax=Burkholderia TaxID=32008 RepID=UPI001ABB3582|nr:MULTISPECIES: hypothetical protein [Burkholderia cepacia complex]MDR6497419.1 hypothetical protein [Burkholderia ambifaria]